MNRVPITKYTICVTMQLLYVLIASGCTAVWSSYGEKDGSSGKAWLWEDEQQLYTQKACWNLAASLSLLKLIFSDNPYLNFYLSCHLVRFSMLHSESRLINTDTDFWWIKCILCVDNDWIGHLSQSWMSTYGSLSGLWGAHYLTTNLHPWGYFLSKSPLPSLLQDS